MISIDFAKLMSNVRVCVIFICFRLLDPMEMKKNSTKHCAKRKPIKYSFHQNCSHLSSLPFVIFWANATGFLWREYVYFFRYIPFIRRFCITIIQRRETSDFCLIHSVIEMFAYHYAYTFQKKESKIYKSDYRLEIWCEF